MVRMRDGWATWVMQSCKCEINDLFGYFSALTVAKVRKSIRVRERTNERDRAMNSKDTRNKTNAAQMQRMGR